MYLLNLAPKGLYVMLCFKVVNLSNLDCKKILVKVIYLFHVTHERQGHQAAVVFAGTVYP